MGYRTPSADIGLSTNVGINEVLLRLHALSVSSRSGKEGRDYLVNCVLPAAFIADLHDTLDGSSNPRTWNITTNIVLFLDGFEALLESSSRTGIRLLEVPACNEHRKHGETDPLLLVVGSRRPLLQITTAEKQLEQDQSHEEQTEAQDELSVRIQA